MLAFRVVNGYRALTACSTIPLHTPVHRSVVLCVRASGSWSLLFPLPGIYRRASALVPFSPDYILRIPHTHTHIFSLPAPSYPTQASETQTRVNPTLLAPTNIAYGSGSAAQPLHHVCRARLPQDQGHPVLRDRWRRLRYASPGIAQLPCLTEPSSNANYTGGDYHNVEGGHW